MKFQFFIYFSNFLFLFKFISLPHALISVSRIFQVSRMWQISQAIYTPHLNLNIKKSYFKCAILAGHPLSQVFADYKSRISFVVIRWHFQDQFVLIWNESCFYH